MNAAVAQGTIPGGVVLVGHDGQVVYRKAFGMRSLEPEREAMTVDTIFDHRFDDQVHCHGHGGDAAGSSKESCG